MAKILLTHPPQALTNYGRDPDRAARLAKLQTKL